MASLVVDTTQTPTVITGSTTGSFTKVTPRKHHGSSSSTTTAATTSTTHVEAATATATATAATAPTAAMSTATAGAPTLHASSSTAARGNARTASPTSTAATGAGAGAGSGAGSRSGSASGPRLTTDGRVTQFHGVTEEGARVSKPTPSLLPPQHAVIDPFFNHQPWSCKLVAKAILTTLILVPIRCAIIVVTIFFGYMFVFASSCCIPKDYNKPFGCCRRGLKRPMSVACRVLLWCLGFVWIQYRRRPRGANTNQQPGIIVSNHVTLVDVFFHIYAYLPSALSKRSVQFIPVIGRGAKAMQVVYIDRRSAASRANGLERVKARAQDRRFPPCLIFPEGTTTNGRSLIEFKRGAFAVGVPVQPVVLRYSRTSFNPADVGHNQGFGALFWCMCQVYNTLEVIELETYVPNAAELADPLLYARNVRRLMAAAMDVPVTDHSLGDFRLMDVAQPANISQTFMIKDLKKKYGLEFEQISAMLDDFVRLDPNHTGRLSLASAQVVAGSVANQQQRRANLAERACLAAHAACNGTNRRVPADWAAGDKPHPSGNESFDFATVVHARGLVMAHAAGYGTKNVTGKEEAALLRRCGMSAKEAAIATGTPLSEVPPSPTSARTAAAAAAAAAGADGHASTKPRVGSIPEDMPSLTSGFGPPSPLPVGRTSTGSGSGSGSGSGAAPRRSAGSDTGSRGSRRAMSMDSVESTGSTSTPATALLKKNGSSDHSQQYHT